MRLLLIDDHAGFCASAQRALEADGHDVVAVANSGASGLQSARELDLDAVLVDVGLPDISGLEVARRLHEQLPNLPVVLISSHDAGDLADLARRNGARGFLTKANFSGETLARLVPVG